MKFIMVDKLKLIMHYLVLLSITFIFNIALIEARCSKTLKLHDNSNNNNNNRQQQLKSSKISRETHNHIIIERSIRNVQDDYFLINNNNDNSSSSSNQYSKDNTDSLRQRQDHVIEIDSELDNLRLEYYKYKILSQLMMKAEPDELNPNINTTLRNELVTTLTQNLTRNNYFRQERRDNGVANLRHKRSLACNQVKSNKDACCLETFYVNFTDIGWDKWIIYPPGYNANYCRGQCDLSHSRYYHSTLLSKFSNVIGLCCSPKQMAPLRLLYIDENNKVHQKSMPEMIVESCDCA